MRKIYTLPVAIITMLTMSGGASLAAESLRVGVSDNGSYLAYNNSVEGRRHNMPAPGHQQRHEGPGHEGRRHQQPRHAQGRQDHNRHGNHNQGKRHQDMRHAQGNHRQGKQGHNRQGFGNHHNRGKHMGNSQGHKNFNQSHNRHMARR